MKHQAGPIALTSLLLGLGFDWLFYGKLPGASVFIYSGLILGFTVYLARRFRRPLSMSVYGLMPVILFFSLMVFIRANSFLAFVNICLTIYLLLMVAGLSHKPTAGLRQYDIAQYLNLFGLPLRITAEACQFLLRAASNRNAVAPKSSYVPIVRGILISLPILFIFLLLLSSADLVFKNIIDSLFSLNVNPETVFRLLLIGFVASLFTGAYAFIFMPSATSPAEANPASASKTFNLGATESSIILGSVSALFLVFVIIQFAYLFGGSSHVASTGYTYAEYARKGFFELIAVAAISWGLILAIKKTTTFRTMMQAFTFKWLSAVLMAEVLVIMLSAHRRLNLYEGAYGFTTLRLLSHLFVLWLAVAFALLLIHIVREKDERNFAFQLFVSVLCFFALINLVNPDNFIARQNINRFNKTGKIDLYYLGNLSKDATPAIAGLLDRSDARIQKSAANILYRQREYSSSDSDWQSANLARQRANRVYRDNAAQIEAGKSYNEYPELDGTR
jgi:hypothetical protein